MTDVIDLAARRVDRIVIEAGTLKSADPDLFGRPIFMLTLHGADGSENAVWQGDSHAAAHAAAAEWAASGMPVSDRTGLV